MIKSLSLSEKGQQRISSKDSSGNGRRNSSGVNLDSLKNIAQQKGFEIEENRDYGFGKIDLVWNINTHPALPGIKCGFIILRSEEQGGGSKDWQDNQFSLRKLEEASMRGIRSGMDKTYLVADNEQMAKSITGKIEWLASFGSLLRLDSISVGLYPEQKRSSVVTPSQERVPQGEKIRKEKIKKQKEKFDRYNRPKTQKKTKRK